MASEYRIHKPYVLATLPKPLDHTKGNIVAREVYGQRDGQKKRKRTELVVGVDGETTSIYDVPASRLITSYPIPPQESFTSPPYSVRVRRNNSSDALRYTFIATTDAGAHKITLFKDVAHRDGKTTSNSVSQVLSTSAVKYLTCSSPSNEAANIGDIIAVCEDGEVVCLSGETLAIRWSSSSKSMVQDLVAANVSDFHVEYALSGSAAEFNEGLFKNRPEVFSALPKAVDSQLELVVLISKSLSQNVESRHLIVLAAVSGDSSASADVQHLVPLDIVPITSIASQENAEQPVYQVDVQSGLLLQLQEGAIGVYDLTGAVPKLKSSIEAENAQSFARLFKPFILASSLNSIGLYNYQYRSVHSKATLDWSEVPTEGETPRSCQLISYLRSQDLVVALVENILVTIQVEPPKNSGKRRKEGLLIDSIGRGTGLEIPTKRTETEAADKLLANNELGKWEDILRGKFGVSKKGTGLTNGEKTKAQEASDSQELPEWEWLSRTPYPAVDRRWIIYAISQIFSVDIKEVNDITRPELRLVLPESNVTTYLVVAGHLTLSNLRTAFRDELAPEASDNRTVAGDLIRCLADADLSLTLLLNYLQATKLGEVELLLAIRALMLSMDLIPEGKLEATKLLTNEPHQSNSTGTGNKEDIEMDLDDLERKIAVTEHYLGDDSSSRSRGLTLAFTKLWRLPAVSTVKALRTTVSTDDIMSLIYLLRVELLRGAWTSLYIDPTSFDSEGNEPPPDGVIALIADLLGRCLDAVGAGGWLFNDAISWADKAETSDFLTALRLEVTAALEGIEEAVFLNGILGETVRFGNAVQKGSASRQNWGPNKPILVHLENRESRLLPLGLKTKLLPTREKVVSGGEVVQRSIRETGHLISQKVEAYSLEKLAI
ncbi:utp8 family domain-containing protein [Trichoderma breve]|uniref:Utp8 family domain-containing protein n=1 Tax=Trichoderma breve TaxID=2034170 RepID=A0A9W9E2W4_9HYPO|nr:utp8 family domain-containing protein [Trichoderma breve]KAJ4854452.1 utp8 family domain-containing protein [Trichoderma breve]